MIKTLISYDAYDFDADGFVDYIEWIVPHLSDQVYEVIVGEEEVFDSSQYLSNISFEGNASHLNISDRLPGLHCSGPRYTALHPASIELPDLDLLREIPAERVAGFETIVKIHPAERNTTPV